MAYFYTAMYRRSRGATWPSFAPALIRPHYDCHHGTVWYSLLLFGKDWTGNHFLVTGGGLLIWWFINLFRAKGLTERHNQQKISEIAALIMA